MWELRSRVPLRVLSSPSKGPVTSVLVLERPLHLAGVRGMGGGSGAGSSRKGPQRPQPLGPFGKFMGTGETLGNCAVVLKGEVQYR